MEATWTLVALDRVIIPKVAAFDQNWCMGVPVLAKSSRQSLQGHQRTTYGRGPCHIELGQYYCEETQTRSYASLKLCPV